MKKATIILSTIIASLLLAFSVATIPAEAFTGGVSSGAASARGNDQPADLFGSAGVFSKITNVLLFIVGAVSVIMIIIGGLRYVISGGDTTNVTAAKNTILYAIVGIIVSILAYAVVNFVLEAFLPEAGGGGSGGTSATNF